VNLKVTLITLGYLLLLLAGQFLWKRGLTLLPGVCFLRELCIFYGVSSVLFILSAHCHLCIGYLVMVVFAFEI